jgi:ATP-dependent 26S proteasome regulatory subunit
LIFYRNVVIIITSNEDKESIDALDPCYLRKGRVDGYYSMMEKIEL